MQPSPALHGLSFCTRVRYCASLCKGCCESIARRSYAHRQPIVDSRLRQRSTLPIGTAARIMGYTHGQLIAASLERRCRLINVRFTEASIARFAAGASFDPIRARLSPALLRWLARPGGRKPVTAVIELASHSPDMCRKRRSKAPRHSAQRWQQLPDIQSLSYGCCMPTAATIRPRGGACRCAFLTPQSIIHSGHPRITHGV